MKVEWYNYLILIWIIMEERLLAMIFMKNKILRIILVFFISVLNSLPAYGIPSISRSSYSKQKEIQLNDSRLKYGEIENKVKAIQSKIYDLNVQI